MPRGTAIPRNRLGRAQEIDNVANTNDSNTSNRGLASADEKTRERVAKAGGEKVSQDREHMAEIGRKGGETVAREKGPEFYSKIGEKGGEKVSRDREHMSEIGQKGGEARGGNRKSDD